MKDFLVYDPDSGHFKSDRWNRLAEILDDMQCYLELQWIPPDHRLDQEKPYRIVQSLPGRPVYPIMYAGELDDPVSILARLWEGDTTKNPDLLRKLEAREKAEQAFQLKQQTEELEAAADEVHFWMTNRSPWYGIRKRPDGTKVKIDTQTGREIS